MPRDRETARLESSAETDPSGLGRLKIFLSYATGVGKTYSMVDEAQRRRSRGQDVVVAILDARGRKDTLERIGDLEFAPTLSLDSGGQKVEEIDVKAVVARKPEVVLVDDLQHTNAPGAPNERRWQDVQQILDAGIGVLTTLDVQHLESLNDDIVDITGIRVVETVPDALLREAHEVEMVDVTPRALINRLERGDVYPGKEVTELSRAQFREGQLSALREIALREIAGRVDEDVEEYRKSKRIQKPWAAHDRVMICLSASASSMRLVRRGWRIGQRLRGEAYAVFVEDKPIGEQERAELESCFALAERLDMPVIHLHGDVAEHLIRFAKEKNITQIIIGHASRSKLQEMIQGSIVSELARELRTIDILVVAHEPSRE